MVMEYNHELSLIWERWKIKAGTGLVNGKAVRWKTALKWETFFGQILPIVGREMINRIRGSVGETERDADKQCGCAVCRPLWYTRNSKPAKQNTAERFKQICVTGKSSQICRAVLLGRCADMHAHTKTPSRAHTSSLYLIIHSSREILCQHPDEANCK